MTYIVNVVREGTKWLADVVGLPGAHAYADNLQDLEHRVQEVIALVSAAPEGADIVPVQFAFATEAPGVDGDPEHDWALAAIKRYEASGKASRPLSELEGELNL